LYVALLYFFVSYWVWCTGWHTYKVSYQFPARSHAIWNPKGTRLYFVCELQMTTKPLYHWTQPPSSRVKMVSCLLGVWGHVLWWKCNCFRKCYSSSTFTMDAAEFPEMVHFSTRGITSQWSEIFRINSVAKWGGNYFPTTACCVPNTNTLMTVTADSYVPT
jgi:hypothetical protein